MGMKMMIIIPCILGLFFVEFGRCDVNSDLQKCSDQLSTVTTCLPYVSGNGATAPKKDCCDGFKSALENKPECICLLIKDRNELNFGFTINVTTAFTLPAKCKITTNRSISDCPALLNLPPNSPDAKVFNDFANSAPKSSVAAPSPVTHGGSTSAPAPIQTTVPQSGVNRRQPSRLETVSLVLLAMAAAPILATI